MPMDMKKRLEKVSLNGMTSATIWLEYSDSEMANPAMKAPRARESPKREVNQAVPRQTRTMVRMNTSLFLSFTTWSKSLGMNQTTAATIIAKAAKERPSFFVISKGEAPSSIPIDWSTMTIRTTARSWNRSTPTEKFPCGVLTSPLSANNFRTIAVDEREMIKPRSRATDKFWPRIRDIAMTNMTVSPTWKPPPIMPSRLMLRSFAIENSNPMVKRRRTTPIWARSSTVCVSLTSAKP